MKLLSWIEYILNNIVYSIELLNESSIFICSFYSFSYRELLYKKNRVICTSNLSWSGIEQYVWQIIFVDMIDIM